MTDFESFSHSVHSACWVKIPTDAVLKYFVLLSPAFSKKSGGTLFLVFRGAWCVVRGSEFLVGTLSP